MTLALKTVSVPKRLVDVTVELQPGELVVVVGPNGAGKSSLVRVLAGTLLPTTGTATLGGQDLLTLKRQHLAQHIAVVTQDLPEVDGFTVREIVAFGRAPHQGRGLHASREDNQIVDAAIQELGLSTIADRAYSALSGGERRRVMLAQAVAQCGAGAHLTLGAYLLLDEPSAFLDVAAFEELFAVIRSLTSRGVGVLAVLHDLALAQRADHVLLLREGRVVALGATAQVLTAAHLEDTFGVAFSALHDEQGAARGFAQRQ